MFIVHIEASYPPIVPNIVGPFDNREDAHAWLERCISPDYGIQWSEASVQPLGNPNAFRGAGREGGE